MSQSLSCLSCIMCSSTSCVNYHISRADQLSSINIWFKCHNESCCATYLVSVSSCVSYDKHESKYQLFNNHASHVIILFRL